MIGGEYGKNITIGMVVFSVVIPISVFYLTLFLCHLVRKYKHAKEQYGSQTTGKSPSKQSTVVYR